MKEREKHNARDRIHKRHVHLHGLGDQVFDLAKHGQVVLGLDVVWIGGVEAGDEAAEGGYSDAFAYSQDGYKVY